LDVATTVIPLSSMLEKSVWGVGYGVRAASAGWGELEGTRECRVWGVGKADELVARREWERR